MKHRWSLFAAVAIAAAALGFHFGQPQVQSPTATDTAAQEAGQKIAHLGLSTPEGVAANLSQWRGKVLVINFWATWCPPCREEMPEFSRAQEKLADKNVQFIGIGIDTPEDLEKARKLI